MALLKFNCPTTGREVDTGVDLDAQTFAALPRTITTLTCPHCEKPHLLAHVQGLAGGTPARVVVGGENRSCRFGALQRPRRAIAPLRLAVSLLAPFTAREGKKEGISQIR
jgi:hypothetical protein